MHQYRRIASVYVRKHRKILYVVCVNTKMIVYMIGTDNYMSKDRRLVGRIFFNMKLPTLARRRLCIEIHPHPHVKPLTRIFLAHTVLRRYWIYWCLVRLRMQGQEHDLDGFADNKAAGAKSNRTAFPVSKYLPRLWANACDSCPVSQSGVRLSRILRSAG